MSSGVQVREQVTIGTSLSTINKASDGKPVVISVYDSNWLGIYWTPSDSSPDSFQVQAKFGPGGDGAIDFDAGYTPWVTIITDLAVGPAAVTDITPAKLIVASTFPGAGAGAVGAGWAIIRVSGMSTLRFRSARAAGATSGLLTLSANN